MRALVTGGAGFIGGHLAGALLARGDEVVIVDSLTDYYEPALKRATADNLTRRGARFVEGDLNTIPLESLLDVDVVFHQAGQPGVRQSWGREFATYVSSNIGATQRLLEAVNASHRSPLVVYASSSSVYGAAESYPTTELALPQPRSPYGVTKLAGEHLATLYAHNFGVRTVSLRYFTVYGPRQRPDMAFTRFIRAALEGSDIHVYGDGEQVRDFTFVDDIVAANLAVADKNAHLGSVFNVSGGSSCSVNEVLDVLESITDRPLTVRRLPQVQGDVRRTSGDSSSLSEATGWRPLTTIDEGLRSQVEWMKSVIAAGYR
ncbi:NAD-dependent epimerase/dehydratase family protein [Mycolicibacterium holsaticum]|uniref:NAD-dependent epimerase/dehydratase family protein n=1 Tax=Mycolicibacterium holsaticum TaxID=152142 RepID=UPI001C7CBA0E|nr:NAD-dependent epimerase/dehydratase family protein [Mycolicibacterium holsaticum]QZA11795.1 NAD-dependent epimerase/dehydratase family protein [Mycolicibacterium holsaticum DSM 44478 = JCM 12374]UNC10717.1 NAD-dependent epimerase/dehydratase family protein [Mycolicibacterium holsaticum DSM 44478 = JCM 12374]